MKINLQIRQLQLFIKALTITIILCCGLCVPLSGQKLTENANVISVAAHTGYIMSHRDNMAHLIKGHIYGGEINYIFKTDGGKPWQQIHKYPEIGVCFLHLYLSNPSELGNLEALYPYTNIRLNKLSKKACLNLRVGVGLAYLTRPFDRLENHKNNAIGTHLNGFVNLRLSSTIMLSNSVRMEMGLGLTHASNGAVQTPNLGLNMATVNLGFGYVFGNKHMTFKKDSIPPCTKNWQAMIIAVAGVKELENPGGDKYLAYGLQGNVYRTLNYKNKLGGGLEMAYNTATKKEWANDSVYNTKPGDIIQAGGKICYAFHMHRVSVPVDFGMYFYKKQALNGNFFHRVGVRYMVTKHLIANVTLLTHWAKADYFEFGIGYQF
ncbi:MAG: acyloxyacyl hydrolase [Bacteroidota bacterium]|nr:acyloxyacyl hydrolase [Bacteroidota bacterium]